MAHETRSYERTRTGDVEQPQHFDGQKINTLEFCEHFILGKQKKVSFSTGKHKTEEVLDYMHSDLWGSSKLFTFIDDFSRKVWVYFLKAKGDALKHLKNGRFWLRSKWREKSSIFIQTMAWSFARRVQSFLQGSWDRKT